MLRDYQAKCVDAIMEKFKTHQSTMAVLFTAAGKTVIFSNIIGKFLPGRVLVIAGADSLIWQAKRSIEHWAKVKCGVEMAGYKADPKQDQVILATWQTLISGGKAPKEGVLFDTPSKRRMNRFKPADFDLVVIDEFHHAAAPSYRVILDYFKLNPKIKILGVTATPKRGDGLALGEVCESTAFEMHILQGAENGWLVDVVQHEYKVGGLDYSHLKITKGDFDAPELKSLLKKQETVAGMCHPILEVMFGLEKHTLNTIEVSKWRDYLAGLNRKPRKTLLFTVSVAQAEMACDIMNRIVPDIAGWVCGKHNKDTRKEIFDAFELGQTSLLANVGITIEGYDCLDAKTAILTPRGWKRSHQVKAGDSCYALNRETCELEVVEIERHVTRMLRPGENMIGVKSQHVDIRVTEGHEIHVAGRGHWECIKAGDLLTRKSIYSLPLAGRLPRSEEGIALSDDELKFIAWFITDGTMSKRGQLSIDQSDASPYVDEIRHILRALGLDWRERLRTPAPGAFATNNKCLEFMIPKGTHSGGMKRNGWNKYARFIDKNIAPELNEMNTYQFTVFWTELLKGDGSVMKGKSGWLWCNKQEQVDAIEHMAVTRGFSASHAEVITEAGAMVYRVSVRAKSWISSNPSDPRSARITVSESDEYDYVWCATNRLSTLITRRNGKIVILGNCPAVEVIAMGRPTLSIATYIQMVGRGTRVLPGIVDTLTNKEDRLKAIANSAKARVRVIDFKGNCGRHNLVTVFDVLGGRASEKAERAKKRAAKSDAPKSVLKTLSIAEAEIEKEKRAEEERRKEVSRKRVNELVPKAHYQVNEVSPFKNHGSNRPMPTESRNEKPFSPAQRKMLLQWGFPIEKITYRQGQGVIGRTKANGWKLLSGDKAWAASLTKSNPHNYKPKTDHEHAAHDYQLYLEKITA